MKNLRQLLEEYSEGKINLKEMIELSDKINDGQSQEAEELLKEEWENQLKVEKSNAKNLKPVLNEIHHRIRLKENRPASSFKRWWQGFQKVAAILIIPVIVGFFVFFNSQAKSFRINGSYAEIQCPMGVRTKFILPDGSSGFLNSGSTLKFLVVFTKDRSVELTGEGYFDVDMNNKKPFYVRTKNLNIEVKGQSMNVIANANEHSEEVVLQKGKINVYSKDGKLLGILSSDEQLILDTEKQTVTTRKVNASLYSAWKDGKLIFSNENMSQVIQRLNRWYNTDIVWIDNHSADHYSLEGTFVNEPLDEVLKYISEKTSLKYKEDLRTFNTDGVFNRRKITIQAQQVKLGRLK